MTHLRTLTLALAVCLPQSAWADAPPEALWVTDDNAAIVASGPCAPGSPLFCAVIVGLIDDSLTPYASDLCDLPVLWDFRHDPVTGGWTGGTMLDPETEKTYPAEVAFDGDIMTLSIPGYWLGAWQRTTAVPKGCS